MDKASLSERDICTKFITPAILSADWAQHQFREEVQLTVGRVVVRGNLAVKALWQMSGLEIDDFYRQLKTEMARGWIVEPEPAYVREVAA